MDKLGFSSNLGSLTFATSYFSAKVKNDNFYEQIKKF